MGKLSTGFLLTMASITFSQHSAIIELPDSIATAGTTVKWVKKLPSYCEGPAVDAEGNLHFTQQLGNSISDWPIWKINPGNSVDTGKILVQQSNQSNGLAFDSQGRLIAAQKGKIVRYKKDGSLDSLLTQTSTAVAFGQANDLSLGSDGSIYFTDLGSKIFYLDNKGKLSVAASGLSGVNGIEWIEEENAVYAIEGGKSQITRYDIQAGGVLANPTSFIKVSGPDGADLDSHGNWYVGSYGQGAVLIFNSKAQQIGKISFKMTAGIYDTRAGDQGNISNCHFGGPARKTLYCVGDGGAYSIDLKIPGRNWPSTVSLAKIKNHAKANASLNEYLVDGKRYKPQTKASVKTFKVFTPAK